MAEVTTYKDVIQTIADNYEEIEHSVVNQLLLNVPNHYPTEGSYRETVWKSLFEMIIPKKYCIEQSVFIIDSYGHKSKEVDLAIFDELYTPYIFNYGKIKFIPVEAVAAVVQCKSKKLNRNNIKEWTVSIDGLITSLDSVARMANQMVDNHAVSETDRATQTATRPIKILCSLAGKTVIETYDELFDIILSVDQQKKKLLKRIPKEEQSLENWNDTLNHALEGMEESEDKTQRNTMKENYKKAQKEKAIQTTREKLLLDLKIPKDAGEGEENVILSLIFQLNQLLMVINNPMLFPHRAYAKKFSDILLEARKEEAQRRKNEQHK